MTVDIISPPQDPSIRWPPGPTQDLVIIYGGWSGHDGPEELAPGTHSGSAQLVQAIQGMSQPPGHQLRILSLQGELVGSSSESRALSFIRQNFHPSSKIIIHGYSAGGVNALHLSQLIQVGLRYYNITSGTFGLSRPMLSQGVAQVRIDLLVTVDIATGPTSALLSRQVPSCVRRNLNFFQTTPSRMRSRGGPNTAADSRSTVIENADLTGQATHDTIDEHVSQRTLEAIQGVLGRRVPHILQVEPAPPVGVARARQPIRPTGGGRGQGISPQSRWEIA